MEREGGTLARLAFDVDPAVTLMHHPVHRRQSQSGAFPLALRREERLEQMGPRLRRNANAVVKYGQTTTSTLKKLELNLNASLPAIRKCVLECVGDQFIDNKAARNSTVQVKVYFIDFGHHFDVSLVTAAAAANPIAA